MLFENKQLNGIKEIRHNLFTLIVCSHFDLNLSAKQIPKPKQNCVKMRRKKECDGKVK